MKYSEDEKKYIRIIAKWFMENKRLVKRSEAIKEFGVDNNRYEVLIRMMEHNGIVEKVRTLSGKNGYAVTFHPSAYAEELAREIDIEIEPEPKEIVNELDNGSQSARATAIRSAAAELEQIANNFKNWADQNKKLIRNFSASLTGPLPPMEYERVVAYLRINNADMAGLVQKHYEELISCAKKIDTLTADSSRSAMGTVASLVGKLGFLANRLAQTLEVTAQNLILEEPTEAEQDTKREREGMIEAKPPETLAKMLWLKQHGKKHWKLISITILVILIPSLFVLPKIELFSKKPNVTANSNIFADVSKDGSILRSNKFPWEIKKTKDRDGNILYTLVDRGGDTTAISVVPDNPKYTVYRSYDGMVIKFTCAEEKISDFTIKVKY